ncbi:hypothetical protein DLJ53_19135 [Acuticoccus sediminis]|uniref:Uncharacterized protein n=2 Tax=Acuticoccus sediminis TaxID=2184697 RepID=A0A8B2NML6_9HYPH|nr:hypothetical protein DLJ53_19135 [Acuticoccus sediminis]
MLSQLLMHEYAIEMILSIQLAHVDEARAQAFLDEFQRNIKSMHAVEGLEPFEDEILRITAGASELAKILCEKVDERAKQLRKFSQREI